MAELEQLVYRPQGAAAELWDCRAPEVLIEGAAGTGKTRAVAELDNYLCETFPGIRILWLRQTLTSLRESVQVTFEKKVLWPEHPILRDGGTRQHRTHYTYPNGSTIVLGGLDKPERLYSTEYDAIRVFEAIETTLDAWEKLVRANRNNVLPWQQMLADTNPGPQGHWLNKRADTQAMVRLKSVHTDNPSLTEDYLRRLSLLQGVRRKRLFLGLWIGEEGQVWANYDPFVHDITANYEFTQTGRHLLHVTDWEEPVELKWFCASMDFGFNAPASLGVFGIDKDDRAYLLAEVYKQQKTIDWWAEAAAQLRDEFPYATAVADCAEPGSIKVLNNRLGARDEDPIFILSDKVRGGVKERKLAGLDMVRQRFAIDDLGKSQLYFCRDRIRYGKDEDLVASGKPWSLTEEIPSYIFAKMDELKPIKEQPDPRCSDHGCDMLEYFVVHAWGRDHSAPDDTPDYKPGTLGDLLKHQEAWEEGMEEWGN